MARGETPVAVLPQGIGSRGSKYEAEALTLGDRNYVDDMRVPGMLHAALHLSAHARAGIAVPRRSRSRGAWSSSRCPPR